MKLHVISRHPTERERPTPLLFIHGMMHGAWCWDVHFLDYFAQHGFAAHAVDLRGHGASEGRERLRWTRIADFVDDVVSASQPLPNPPVLVGHSMGGFIVQKYLEAHDAANLTLSLWPAIATPRLARESFFSADVPDDELRGYWEQMQDESYLALLDMVALDLPKPAKVRTPMLVLGAARDNMLARREIEATARAYHAPCEIVPDVAHDSMLELHWRDVAERILAWLDERAA